jgi:hypothetical protein
MTADSRRPESIHARAANETPTPPPVINALRWWVATLEDLDTRLDRVDTRLTGVETQLADFRQETFARFRAVDEHLPEIKVLIMGRRNG